MATCGRISIWVAFVLVLGIGRAASASTLTVAWDPSPGPEVTGYIVSYGTQSGSHPTRLDVGARTLQAVSGLTDGVTYYFVVQAYDTQGLLSDPSVQVSAIAGVSIGALTITCPAPSATSYDGKPVTMSFSPVVNGGTQPVTTVCSPPSGTAFPVGTTAVSCVATDAVQQTASCSTTATVVSNHTPAPAPGSYDFEGIVSGLNGSCPALAFSAASYRVFTDEGTLFNQGPCRPLQEGTRVRVIGVARWNGVVSATSVTIVAPPGSPAPPSSYDFEGIVSGLNGSCPALAFSAGSYRVFTDEGTMFNQGSCQSLKEGTRVGVIGVVRWSPVISAISITVLQP